MNDNPVKNAYSMLMHHVGVSIFWLFATFFSLLILTGAATASAVALTYKIQDDQNAVYLVKDFINGIKKNFLYATPIFIISVGLYGLFFLTWQYALSTSATIILIMTSISVLYLTVFNLHVYPLIAMFKHESIFKLMKNTLLFMHVHIVLTIKLILVLLLYVSMIMLIHPILFLPGLAVYFMLFTYQLRPVYDRYIQQFKETDNHG